MASTYTPIATTTLGSGTGTVTFSSIPSTYTDLVLVASFSCSAATATVFRLNGDTGNNYSYTYLAGGGGGVGSGRNSNASSTGWTYDTSSNVQDNGIAHFNNYANTTTYKTILSRGNTPETQTVVNVNLWRSTSAINTIAIIASSANFNTGSTFTLYGITAA